MKNLMKRFGICVIFLILVGCAAVPIYDQNGNYLGSNMTVDAGRLTGAGTGALVGGALGFAVGGDPMRGALAGAAIGGLTSGQNEYYHQQRYRTYRYSQPRQTSRQYREPYQPIPVYNVSYYEQQRQGYQPHESQYSESCKARYDSSMMAVEQFVQDTQNKAEFMRLKQKTQNAYATCVGRQ